MAKRFKLRELEQQRGDLEKVIPPLVNRDGQKEAARVLGTTQATISNWLKANRYRSKTVYEKAEAEVTPALEGGAS